MQFSGISFNQGMAMVNTIRRIDLDPVAQTLVKFNLQLKSLMSHKQFIDVSFLTMNGGNN